MHVHAVEHDFTLLSKIGFEIVGRPRSEAARHVNFGGLDSKPVLVTHGILCIGSIWRRAGRFSVRVVCEVLNLEGDEPDINSL